jgi:hypothetical protein
MRWASTHGVKRHWGNGRIIQGRDRASDQERRQQEAMERQIARSEFVHLAADSPQLTAFLAYVRDKVAGELMDAGYHQQKCGE